MGSDRVRVREKSSSALTPAFKPKRSNFLQPYQDRFEAESDSFTEDKQQNSSTQSNTRQPSLSHSFGRVSVRPIQTKLTIGQPGDKYEQEADRVAEQVMRMPEPGSVAQKMTSSVNPSSIQRICSECEEELQRQPMEEVEEEEEEKILQSQSLVKQITPLVQRQAELPEEEEEEDKLAMKPLSESIQRQEVCEEEEEEDKLAMKPLVQRRVDGGGVASADLESTIEAARRQGQPLGDEVRGSMEQAFGADFSGVRIHNDSGSDQLNQSIQARAFTTGQDIFFGQGAYKPGDKQGQALLAHELTHVVQQNSDKVQRRSQHSSATRLDKGTTPANNTPETFHPVPVLAGEAASSSVLSYLQSLAEGASRDSSVYRKEISRFQEANPSKRIRSSQYQLLEQPKVLKVVQKDNSQALRGWFLTGCKSEDKKKKSTLLPDFEKKFPDSAALIRKSSEAMRLVNEAGAAGVEFGGFAEDGPAKGAWPYTVGNKVYVPKGRDKVQAMSDFLFELNNAIRKPQFAENERKAAAGKITAKEYARRKVELEVEGMLRTGNVWAEAKKALGGGKKLDKYDADFFLSQYKAFKAGKKSKDDIVNAVLKWKNGLDPSKTNEQFYMDQHKELRGTK